MTDAPEETPRFGPFRLWMLPSAAALVIAFSIGSWSGRAGVVSAQYITRDEFKDHLKDHALRELRDSLVRDDDEQRNARIEHKVDRIACKILKECD